MLSNKKWPYYTVFILLNKFPFSVFTLYRELTMHLKAKRLLVVLASMISMIRLSFSYILQHQNFLGQGKSRHTRVFSTYLKSGQMYLVATPLGNLGDITLRSLDILNRVDIICAEDTRRTLVLLRHYKIEKKTMISHHQYDLNIRKIINSLISGKSVAVVSDAGTPGISDPGHAIVAACIEHNIPVHPIPGKHNE